MNYYRIVHSLQKLEIGTTFPQVQTTEEPVPVDSPRGYRQFVMGYFPDNVIFPHLIMHQKSRLSDLISSSMLGLQLKVSSKLKKVLLTGTDDRFQWFPLKLIFKGASLDYWILNPVRFSYEYINFAKSECWVIGPGATRLRKISIESPSDFIKTYQNTVLPESILVEKMILRSDLDEDFFAIDKMTGGIGYYVTEKLKQAIFDAGCTGIEFELVSTE